MIKKTFALALVIVLIASLLFVFSRQASIAKSREQAALKNAEAAMAESAGLRAASEASSVELERAILDRDNFLEQVEMLQVELESVVAVSTEVREVTRWRTETIEVPVERLVPHPVEVRVPSLDCPVTETGGFAFEVEGSDARIETELGNLFATGVVELYRVRPAPRLLLGSAPWRSEVTDVMVAADTAERPVLRRSLMFGYVFDRSGGYTVKYAHRVTRRLGWYVGVLGGDVCRGYPQDECQESTRLEGGGVLAF